MTQNLASKVVHFHIKHQKPKELSFKIPKRENQTQNTTCRGRREIKTLA